MAEKRKGTPVIVKLFVSFMILLIVFLILPIGIGFIVLFDASKMDVTYSDSFNKDTWMKEIVVDSLDDTVENEWVSFSVSEQNINDFIHSATKDSEVLNKYLTQLAVDVTDDSYVLSASGKLYFMESRARVTAKLSKEVVVSDGVEQEAFVLKFDKLQVGRLSKLKSVVMFFLQKLLNQKTLDELANNLHVHVDLENSCAFIYIEDLKNLLMQAVGGGGGTNEFYFTLINDFLSHNLVNIDFYDNDSLNLRVDLSRLKGNDYGDGQYVAYKMPYEETTTELTINDVDKKLSLDTIREAVVQLLNEGIINTDQMTSLSSYLFNGSDGSNVPEYSLASIGISDIEKETYPGLDLGSIKSPDQVMVDSIATFGAYDPTQPSFDLCSISEIDFNDYIKRQSAFGHKYFLQRELSASNYKVNYIAIDNAYVNLTDSKASISVGLNINGLETWATVELLLDTENINHKALVYNVSSVYFGSKSEGLFVSQETEQLIFSTLSSAIQSEAFSFSPDGKMTIGFNDLIEEATGMINTGNPSYDASYRNFLEHDADFEIFIEGSEIEDLSHVKIKAVRH